MTSKKSVKPAQKKSAKPAERNQCINSSALGVIYKNRASPVTKLISVPFSEPISSSDVFTVALVPPEYVVVVPDPIVGADYLRLNVTVESSCVVGLKKVTIMIGGVTILLCNPIDEVGDPRELTFSVALEPRSG